MLAYAHNLLKIARGETHLRPRVAVYYVTGQCNLNCAYCEDFGARRNAQAEPPAPPDAVRHILNVIRSGVDALWLTGGEPLLHPQIDEIIRYARRDLKFRQVTLITNGSLLHQHESTLSHLHRLVVSMDALDAPLWQAVIGSSQASQIRENIIAYAQFQKKYGFRMALNCVLTPETLPAAPALVDFCAQHGLLVSFSPQAVNNWPRYEVHTHPAYRPTLEELIRRKKAGAPILGSVSYLTTLRDLRPYACYPTLAPRIAPNGELSYPCRPLEKAQNGQGGKPVNLQNVQTWAEAWQTAQAAFGAPPQMCASCFQQCYAEPSLMQSAPLGLLWETIRYPASRAGDVSTYAPG